MSQPLPLWAEKFAVFDTETTGVNTNSARIVTASIAVVGGQGNVLERYDWMIDPGVEIPAAAAHVHGITTEIARASGIAAPVGITQVTTQLQSMMDRGFALVVYNAPYDLSLLQHEAARHSVDWQGAALSPIVDPLVLDKQLDRYRKGKRTLEVVSAHYGVTLDAAHDAGADAIAAGHVAQAIARKYHDELPEDVMTLHELQKGWAAEQAASLQEYLRRVRDPNTVVDAAWPIR